MKSFSYEKEENKMIICYGSENITLNQGENHIILTNSEAGYLLKSLMKNLDIVEVKTR